MDQETWYKTCIFFFSVITSKILIYYYYYFFLENHSIFYFCKIELDILIFYKLVS